MGKFGRKSAKFDYLQVIYMFEMKIKLLSDRVSNEDVLVKFSKSIPKAIIEKQKSDHGINAMAIERVIASNIEPLVADAIIEKNNSSKEKITLTITVNKNNDFSIRKYKN